MSRYHRQSENYDVVRPHWSSRWRTASAEAIAIVAPQLIPSPPPSLYTPLIPPHGDVLETVFCSGAGRGPELAGNARGNVPKRPVNRADLSRALPVRD